METRTAEHQPHSHVPLSQVIYPTLQQMAEELAPAVQFVKLNCNKANKDLGKQLGGWHWCQGTSATSTHICKGGSGEKGNTF